MGQSKDRLGRFLKDHPLCFSCGEPAVERDHLPSRACFDGRDWPEEFEFPVCRKCNKGTANDEQVLALLSRSHSGPDAPVREAEMRKYMTGVANNHPDLFRNMLTKVAESPDPAFGEEASLVEVGADVKECVKRVLPKWARAFHYLETREILPRHEPLYGGFFTPVDVQKGRISLEMLSLPSRPIMRNNKDLSGQFSLLRSVPEDKTCCIYVALFRRSFGVWMAVDKNATASGPEAAFSLLPNPFE